MHALGLEFGSAAQLSKRPGSVWNCLWGNALKRSPGIIRKSRVSYPGPGFLSSATWPSLPKKHYNGLNQTKAVGTDGGLGRGGAKTFRRAIFCLTLTFQKDIQFLNYYIYDFQYPLSYEPILSLLLYTHLYVDIFSTF